MRNNPYKNMIKVLTPKKCERLIIQRVGDYVYMTETHVAFKVRYSLYQTWIHAEKPFVFPELSDGDCFSNGERCDMNIERCMDDHKYTFHDATMTNIIFETTDKHLARLALVYEPKTGNYIPLALNENYYQSVTAFLDDSDCKVRGCGSANYPIWIECDAMTALILPIRINGLSDKKHGKALADLAGIELWTSKTHVA